MKQWEPGVGQAYVARSLEEARECMESGFAKHLELFGLEANAVKVSPSFPWPEAFGDRLIVADEVGLSNMLIVCRVEDETEEKA